MKNQKQTVSKLMSDFENLKENLNVGDKRKELIILEKKSADPNLWKDREKAKKLMQEFSDLNKELEEIDSLGKDLGNLRRNFGQEDIDLKKEKDIKSLIKRYQALKVTTLLSAKHDRKNAIISIHAGQGGTEAMDWVSMLYRMYLKYCEKRNWQTTTLDMSAGDEAGIKSVTFKVAGAYVYGYLKGEAGTHRLVRQSPFNADKLRQTSFALVEVLPEFEEVDLPDIKIKDDDLDWQFFRASAHGGQNVQKVSTAVRLKHIPSGIVVTSQVERYQEKNRKIALNVLRSRLWMAQKLKQKETKEKLKGDYRPASWGNQIRSYVLHPYKMVKDLRTKVETKEADEVLDGDLDQFIEQGLSLEGNNS